MDQRHSHQPPTRATDAIDRRGFLKGAAVAALGLGMYRMVLPASAHASAAERRPPNFVFVFVDDLGWRELGCYGNTFNETPNLDRMAREGLKFLDAYAAAPICSPTRAATLTGKYPARTGITDFLKEEPGPSNKYLHPAYTTLPEPLADTGYTSALIGKWHLTETYSGPYESRAGSPLQHGFDPVILSETRYIGPGDYFYPYQFMPEAQGNEGEYLTDRLNTEAIDFITANADQPFFLYLSHYAPHRRHAAPADIVQKYEDKPGAGELGKNPVLAAMIEVIDDGVGRIIDTLQELDIADNTLLIFMSDNGGDPRDTVSAPLRGHKGLLYEGGIRVPMITYWQGAIPPGSETTIPVNSVDLYPTFLELAGADLDRERAVDGVSIASLLLNPDGGQGSAVAQRDTMYWLFPHFNVAQQAVPQAAVRSGEFKLIRFLRDGRSELYNLREDIGEAYDIVEEEPDKARELGRMLEQHIRSVGVPPPPPTLEWYPLPLIVDNFGADPGRYASLTPPQSQGSDIRVEGGALTVSGTAPFFNLFRSSDPASDPSAAILEVRSFAGTQSGAQDTIYVGLVKDELNYVLALHNNRLSQTGWEIMRDGVLTTGRQPGAGGNRVGMLDGTVHLNSPRSKLAFVLDTNGGGTREFTVFVFVRNRWEYLFTADVEELVDLNDASVRAAFKYGFGVRSDSGPIALEAFEVRRPADGP